jgi:translation elongation factor EF-G
VARGLLLCQNVAAAALGARSEQEDRLSKPEKMRFEVFVPPAFVDKVVSDLESRGATVSVPAQVAKITGSVPLDAMAEYAVALRALTDGYGTYELRGEGPEAKPEGA